VGALQPAHLILVLALVLIIFGPGKLPQLGKSLGDGIREFRRGTDGEAAADPEPIDAAPSAAKTVDATVVASTTSPVTGSSSTASAPSSVAPADSACQSCQSPLAADARFCGSCGAAQAA
jgi:sec-independent protein translocase protein TatA